MFLDPKKKSPLEIRIDQLIVELGVYEPKSDEYGLIVERLTKLHKIQDDISPEPVSPNTALTVFANLFGIFMIVQHEKLDFITSKALGFVKHV